MNFLDLSYYLTTVKEMNFTRAAEKLYVTQQTLSNRISKIERELGVYLFDRTPPLSLTEEGKCLAAYASRILAQKREMDQALQDIQITKDGSLSISVQTDRGTNILPKILTAFQEKYPSVRLCLFEGSASDIIAALETGATDLAIAFPIQRSDIKSIPIYREHFVVVIPNNIFEAYFSPEERQDMLKAESLPIDVFRNCPFLAYRQATWLRDIFLQCCLRNGVTPKIIMETSNLYTRSALCFSGLGFMFVSQSFLDNNFTLHTPDNIKVFKIHGVDCSMDISINYLKNKYQTKAAKSFIQIARRVMSSVSA